MISRRSVVRNGWMVAAGLAAAPWNSRSQRAVAADGPVERSWTLGHDFIARTLTFISGKGLFTKQFSDGATHVEYMPAGKVRPEMVQEFSFQCDGRHCAGTGPDFEFISAKEETQANGKSLTLRLRHKALPLEVAAVYRVYSGHAALRKHLVLRNVGSSRLRISHLQIESLAFAIGPENEVTLRAQYGTIPREIFYTGRSEDAGLLLSNGRTGVGLAILSEVPGYMKRTEIEGWDFPDVVRIGALYDTDLMPFERTLASGEEFTTANVSLVLFKNGDGFNDPHWRLPSYTAQILMRRVDAHGAPWIYNTWEPFERGINHDIVLQLIDVAASIGMDIFTIDDGWQQEYGDNSVNLASFPGGLRPILEAIEAKGMRLGLWIPLAAIGSNTPDYRSHPDWASRDNDGNVKTTGTMGGQKVVMCMATPFRDVAAARVIDAIDRFHLAYVKLDITTIFNAYGEAPGCWAPGHDHANWAESLSRIYEGMAAMTAKVYEKHPDVLLDLTFELWGQKHVIDAGLLAAGDLDWMSNVDDRQPDSAGTLQARQLLYQRAASMPVESMLIGNIHAGLPTPQDSFATVIGSAPLFLGDLRVLSPSDRAWLHDKIAWFKNLRSSTKISESFFPLGSSLQTNPDQWDGFARLARNGHGLMALFRNKSTEATARVQLPLLPLGTFEVRSIVTGKEVGKFTHEEWTQGVSILFSKEVTAEVLEITPAASQRR